MIMLHERFDLLEEDGNWGIENFLEQYYIWKLINSFVKVPDVMHKVLKLISPGANFDQKIKGANLRKMQVLDQVKVLKVGHFLLKVWKSDCFLLKVQKSVNIFTLYHL